MKKNKQTYEMTGMYISKVFKNQQSADSFFEKCYLFLIYLFYTNSHNSSSHKDVYERFLKWKCNMKPYLGNSHDFVSLYWTHLIVCECSVLSCIVYFVFQMNFFFFFFATQLFKNLLKHVHIYFIFTIW